MRCAGCDACLRHDQVRRNSFVSRCPPRWMAAHPMRPRSAAAPPRRWSWDRARMVRPTLEPAPVSRWSSVRVWQNRPSATQQNRRCTGAAVKNACH